MPKKNLSDKLIQSLYGVPLVGQWGDKSVAGLSIMLRSTSRHVWVLHRYFNGKMRKLTLGPISEYSLSEAREWAIEQGRVFNQGLDPVHEKKRNEDADRLRKERICDWLFELYMDRVGNTQRSAAEKRRIYERDIRPFIGNRSYFDIKHEDLAVILESKFVTAPIMSNRILALIKAIFGWSVSRGRGVTGIIVNPTTDLVKLSPEKGRSRSLDYRQLPLYLKALTNRESNF